MSLKTVAVIACLLAAGPVWGGPPGPEKGPRLKLMETGEYHGDEISASTGERWLGLFQSGSGFALLPARVTVERVHDIVVDADPEVKTGKKVSVGRPGKPVFLLSGAGAPRPGAVTTVFREEKALGNAEVLKLSLGGREYVLRVLSDNPRPADYLMENSRLVLTSGGESQVLFSVRRQNDAGWFLLWAGDLDGDRKLDLYMDLATHYNASQRRLFLSTWAPRGGLVREAAVFSTVGC